MTEPEEPKKLCFVIGPIGSEGTDRRRHADLFLNYVVRAVFSDRFTHFRVERADTNKPGMITSQIVNSLYDAELVIADLSFQNPNVYYELAYRHEVRKPVIHMVRREIDFDQLPFDILPHRVIPFSLDSFEGFENGKSGLIEAVHEVLRPDFIAENPISLARARVEVGHGAISETRLVLAELRSMNNRLDALSHGRAAPREARDATQDKRMTDQNRLQLLEQARKEFAELLPTIQPACEIHKKGIKMPGTSYGSALGALLKPMENAEQILRRVYPEEEPSFPRTLMAGGDPVGPVHGEEDAPGDGRKQAVRFAQGCANKIRDEVNRFIGRIEFEIGQIKANLGNPI